MTILYTYIIWIAFASISGILEGDYWSRVSHGFRTKTGHEHTLWTILRFIIASILVFWLYQDYGTNGLLGYLTFACMFPFFHDGYYYMRRNDLDGVYPLRFKDKSTTSTAKTPTIDWYTRLVLVTWFNLLLTLFMVLYR